MTASVSTEAVSSFLQQPQKSVKIKLNYDFVSTGEIWSAQKTEKSFSKEPDLHSLVFLGSFPPAGDFSRPDTGAMDIDQIIDYLIHTVIFPSCFLLL